MRTWKRSNSASISAAPATPGGQHARRRQDVLLAVELLVCRLHRLQRDRGTRDDHRTDDAQHESDQQGSADGFLLSR
jgi:hypothetical protein